MPVGSSSHQLDHGTTLPVNSTALQAPFYLLLNLAVGGAWPGIHTDQPSLPASLDVDWIRVWAG